MKTRNWFGSLTALGICAAGLIGFTSNASATVISGADLSGLTYRDNGGVSQFVVGSPDYALLSTADSGLNGGAPTVYVKAANIGALTLGTLNSFSARYSLLSLSGGNGNQPYWLTYLYAPGGGYIGVVSFGGPTLDLSSQTHVFYDYATSPLSTDTHWGLTLAQLDGTAYGTTTFGQLGVYESGVEIGDWNNGNSVIPAEAKIGSITIPVPDGGSTAGLVAASIGMLAFMAKRKALLGLLV